MNKLLLLSRHYPSYAQIELAKVMGFEGIRLEKVVFPDSKAELEKIIDILPECGRIVGLVSPTWVHTVFWENGFSTIEFVRSHISEEVISNPKFYNIFICRGAWLFKSNGNSVKGVFTECPLTMEEQLSFAGREISE